MKGARDLSRERLVKLVDHVQQILYLDADADGMIWNPGKEWDSETIDSIAAAMINAGLKPDQKTRREDPHARLPSVVPDVTIPAKGQEARREEFFQRKVNEWMNDGEREIVRVLALWATRAGTQAAPRIELGDYLEEYLGEEPTDLRSRTMNSKLPIDFARLRQQKRALLALIGADSPLMGVVELIDAIQDQAVDAHGVPEKQVFGPAIEE